MSWRGALWIGARLLLVFLISPRSVAASQYSRRVTYQGEIVVRCPDKSKPTVQTLQEYSDVLLYGKESVDVRIKKSAFARVEEYFPECSIVVENLEASVQAAEEKMFPRKMAEQDAWMKTVIQSILPNGDVEEYEARVAKWKEDIHGSDIWFRNYHNYSDIIDWYKYLAREYNKVVTLNASIGKTYERRDMPSVHITASRDSARKKFYMQCQIHAREWISGAVCMYIAYNLAREYGVNKDITNLLNNLEIVLVPFVNPDGYAYTWEFDRMWRKNRMKHSTVCNGKRHDKCVGVDINRNFPEGFKIKCNPCAEDYGGPRAVSELETQHIINNFRNNAPIIGSLDFHSYGQLILRPWGMTNQSSEHESIHKRIGSKMVELIKNVKDGKTYTSERSYDLYPCYGIVADWMYSTDAARTNGGYRSASLCLELRDTSEGSGFLLPADQILPTAKEVLPAVLYYMKEMLKHPITYNNPSSSSSDARQVNEMHSHKH